MDRRLIDANALIERIKYSFHNDERVRIDTVTETFLEECCSPTIDAVEVVRCRECNYLDKRGNECVSWCICKHFKTYVYDDFYCALGERRELDDD